MIVASDHIAVIVEDLDAMIGFYTNVIGLKVNKRVRNPNIEIAYLGASETESQLELLKFPDDRDPGLKHFCYEVTELEKTCAGMKEKGAEFFIDPKTQGDGSGKLAFLTDPEGNVIELVEPGVLAMQAGLFET